MKEHKVHPYAKFHGIKASVLAHYNGVSALPSVVVINHSQEECTSRKQTISQKEVYLKQNAA